MMGILTRKRRSPLPEWAIPFLYAVTAFLAGLILPRIENRLLPALVHAISVPVALTLFSSITSGMIALTGIVFSLAFVMVQFSAVAYSPRLVVWVSRDPVIWHSIGIFTATFLYALEAMAWVDRSGSGKVPFLSGWLVVILMLASVGMFIALIQRIGLLQVSRMLAFTGDLGRQVIEQLYPPLETPASTVLPDEAIASHHKIPLVHAIQPPCYAGEDPSRQTQKPPQDCVCAQPQGIPASVVEYVAPGISRHATGYAGQGIPMAPAPKNFYFCCSEKLLWRRSTGRALAHG